MADEQLGILKLRPVIGVGVDDELRVRDILLHDVGVDRRHDHVVTAVHNECWLLDRLEIIVGPLFLDAPFVHRFNLGGRNLVVHLGIAPLLAKMLALQELLSCRLGRLGRTEEDREPHMLGRIIDGAEDPLCDLGHRLHGVTAARTRAHQDQLADEIGSLQRDFLRDHAADREAEHIRLAQTKCSAEGDRVGAHLLARGRTLAGAARNARVFEQDPLTLARQAIRPRRVPVIHCADVVHIEHERYAVRLAEAAIGEADSVSFDELCRRGLVGMHHCGRSFIFLAGTASGTSARAAFAQSTSFCTVGAPLSPIAPTISPSTLIGNPPPHAATRASVGMPAKSDGSPWIKLKKSWLETPNKAVYALFCSISMERIGAPSIRLKALRLPPSSRIATFSATPIFLAFATA